MAAATRGIAVAVVLGLALAAGGRAPAPAPANQSALQVVVQQAGPGDAAALAVERLGGDVGQPLPIIDGFTATIPASALPALEASAGVRTVTVNRPVVVTGQFGEGSGTASAVYTDVVRASKTWAQGYTGRGVGVAIIDTGVNAVGDLAGKVLHAEDFSPEQNNVDTYGHGTFIAGLIAGQGTASNGAVKGVAPDAHLVSVKIAGADGRTDLVRLLAALEWVVTFREVYGIRVLNLSLGSDSRQSYLVDPLNFAVERVWNSGIVVVAASGNGGTAPGTVAKPGDDPFLVTVGANDDRTTPVIGDDTLAPFSGTGPTPDGVVKPDLVAPGKSVVSARAAGSTIDTANPGAQVLGDYLRGSGTSFSSALAAGASALVISRDWTLSPNQVKQRLVTSARSTLGIVPAGQGAGVLDAFGATMSNDRTVANQGVRPAGGGGSLQASRGSGCLTGADGSCLTDAEADALTGFDATRYFGSSWAGSSWAGSSWAGSSWAGSSWAGSSWAGSSWAGSSWAGSSWAGSSWAGSSWSDYSWLGSHWM